MNEDGLIREVNEAFRQEKLQHALKTFGRYILIISCLIIFATIAYVWVQNNKLQEHETATLELYQAIDMVEQGNAYQAREIFDRLAASAPQSIALLADMWRIKLKMSVKKQDEAEALAKEIKNEFSATEYKPYHDWLDLYLPVDENITSSTYRITQQERLAIQYIRESKLEAAADIYQSIANNSQTPSTMRDRANYLLTTFFQKIIKPEDVPLPQTLPDTDQELPAPESNNLKAPEKGKSEDDSSAS